MQLIEKLTGIVGASNVLTGPDMARFSEDITGKYASAPLAVLRPGSTGEVSRILALAHQTGTPVVPVSGNTGLVGGTQAKGGLMLSLDRMNAIREIRPAARIAVVEAGVILSRLHEAVEAHGLVFPLSFGAKGSALIGGALSTNAGGSNVVRYGSTRGLCLGLEVVLADGQVMDLMTELHKDNSGYDLKDLFIGSEGTLGVITGAVLRLFPQPRAYATAMVAAAGLPQALTLLNRLQEATGGAVEAFEYMPRRFIEKHLATIPGAREPFADPHEVNIMVEVGATAPRDARPGPDGEVPIATYLQETLAAAIEDGLVLDAAVAQSEAQRAEIWARREAAAEITMDGRVTVDTDIAFAPDLVPEFFDLVAAGLARLDPAAETMAVAHLGDGNIHYTVYPTTQDPAAHQALLEMIEGVTLDLGGSFSAEHGIGLSKLGAMRRHKDVAALEAMRAIKSALDPTGILNPGKVLPD